MEEQSTGVDPTFFSKIIDKCATYKAQTEVEKVKLSDLKAGYAAAEGDTKMTDAVAAAKEEISKMVAEAAPPPPQPHVEQR